MFALITREPVAPRSRNAESFRSGAEVNMSPVHCRYTDHARSARYVKHHWEKLYRAAVLESDRSKLPQRIENAEAAILERSQSLSKPRGNRGKEQHAITRALQILSWLREGGQAPHESHRLSQDPE